MKFIFSDKEQLLEVAKANAAAMCAKAGMPIPASLRTSALPYALPNMAMNAAMASMTAGTICILFLFQKLLLTSNNHNKNLPFVDCIICVAPDSENQNQPMNL